MKRIFFLLPLLFLLSCGGSATEGEETTTTANTEIEAEQAAYSSMVEAHDRVMPRMGEIARAQGQIREAIAQDGMTEENKSALNDLDEKLEGIQDEMMNWMQEAMRPVEDVKGEVGKHEDVMSFYGKYQAHMESLESSLDRVLEITQERLNNGE